MVSSRRLSRALVRLLAAALVPLFLGALAPRLEAGPDDFEFGQKLAQSRYFALARKVYARMLESPKASEVEKELARFGLATLGYQEALTASVRTDATFADVLKLFDTAADQIDQFAKKNPNHPKAKDARLLSGQVRLQVVLWCRELLDKPEILAARKTTAGEVAAAARSSIDVAVAHFDALRTVEGELGELANYNWTMCQYYRALTLDPGSPPQIEALKAAEISLEQYIQDHDGELLAVFAQDVLGQALAERAKHASDPLERVQLLTKALNWFQTCIDQENLDTGTLTVITNGYLHYAQTCLDAGRIGNRNFLREGVEVLSKMLERLPTAARTHGGIKALLYYGDLEKGLGNAASAVRIYKDASDRAKQAGFSALENEANSRLKGTISGAGSLDLVTDVNVLRKVADSLFLEKRYEESIRTFQSVIAGAPATPNGFVDFVWPAWERIAASYKELGDPLSAAMAYEAVHEAWMDGRIPYKKGDDNDVNMKRAGGDRKRGAALLDELATRTGSKVLREAYKRADTGFATDYPDHPDAKNSELRVALEKIKAARDAKRAKLATWRALYEEARVIFLGQAKSLASDNQDTAYAQIVLIDAALSDGTPEGKKAAERGLTATQAALDFWASAPAKQKLAEWPALASRRQEAQLTVRGMRGTLFKVLDRWDDVLKEMRALRAEQGDNERGEDAQALIVEAHIRKGDTKAADEALVPLLKRGIHPSIPPLVGKIANRFDDVFRDLTKQFNAANEELNGSKDDRAKGVAARLRAAQQRYNDLLSGRVNVTQKYDEHVRQIGAWRKDPLLVKGMTEKTVKELEATTLPALKQEVAKFESELPVVEQLIKQLGTRAEELAQEILRITAAQYEPLSEAVNRYDLGLESQLVNASATVKADDIQRVAARWYAAARNAKGTDADWGKARKRYEQFLEHAETKALPEGDSGKRAAITKLGRIYSYFSAREEDPVKRAELVRQAILMLETSLASRPENTELMLGLLSGRYGALVWENPLEMGPLHRFILPKTQDAAALRAAIAKLGGPDSPVGILKMPDEGKQVVYRKALTAWRDALAQVPPEDFERTFKSLQGSGLDAATYRELGNTGHEFRISLAAAYAESGDDAELAKGDVILATLLKGPISVEAFSDDYWEVATLVLRHLLNHAERLSSSGGVPARASALRKKAKDFVLGQTSVASVPLKDGVRDTWKKLMERLNKGLRGEGAPEVSVDFDKLATPAPAVPAPGVPGPGVPGPGVPAPGVPAPVVPAPAVPAPGVPAPGVPPPAGPEPEHPAPGDAPRGGGK